MHFPVIFFGCTHTVQKHLLSLKIFSKMAFATFLQKKYHQMGTLKQVIDVCLS